MIIGICGRKRHGKDSVGRILRDHHGFNLTAFADAVKRVAMDVYGLSWEQCYGDGSEKEDVDPRWGLSPRVIMQRIGTEVGRGIHENTWVQHTLENIALAETYPALVPYRIRDDVARKFKIVEQGGPDDLGHARSKWAVTDVRFPNEAQAIRAAGGLVIKVVRPSLGVPTDEHPSETSVDLVYADITIVNDGTLDDLALSVHSLVIPKPHTTGGLGPWHELQSYPWFSLDEVKARRWGKA